ncbi:Yip1-domain-containing protein [Pholiota conissans]|uniref:Protein YIP n=1 Tax=Pholiota conissans TaxID=109636 RepID=A0A9P5YTY7_9AGAR|nr:Yip1-domain-containing protein [Pholiota conissans]
MWQQDHNPYAASSSYYPQQQPHEQLQFYAQSQDYYVAARTSLDSQVQGSIQQPAFGGNIQSQGGWWTAFGTGGVEGEPPLLEELGINFQHIRDKSLTVLNPLRRVDEHIMDDADLAGPIFFIFCFGVSLLFSGKSNFNYIYGVGLFGSVSLYTLLNLMSEQGIDAYRVASVLGYCLLPMVGIGAISVMVALDGAFGYLLSTLSILWCTYAASGIFVAVLRMSDQRLLVAYPIGLLYGCFALLSIFNGAEK